MAISKVKLPDNSSQDIHDARITGVDSTPTSSSTNVVTSGGVYTELVSRPKYYLCANETEYTGITTKDSSTLYLIPKT